MRDSMSNLTAIAQYLKAKPKHGKYTRTAPATAPVHPDPEPVNDEYAPTERPSVPSRNTRSRYGLRHNPKPTTYPDFLVHDLHGTPALQELLLKNKNL